MKKTIVSLILVIFLISLFGCSSKTTAPSEEPPLTEKPVIYLYPQQVSDVSVHLDFQGTLAFTYPAYENGWHVTAQPDGTLICNGREYSYLFWDGYAHTQNYDMSHGFVIKGSETEAFLRETLAYMGLTPREYNEFIVYWLPRMKDNPYNLITFQEEAYTQQAALHIDPQPDSMLRVFMVFKALEEEISIEEPCLQPFTRQGFTVVEWGGLELMD